MTTSPPMVAFVDGEGDKTPITSAPVSFLNITTDESSALETLPLSFAAEDSPTAGQSAACDTFALPQESYAHDLPNNGATKLTSLSVATVDLPMPAASPGDLAGSLLSGPSSKPASMPAPLTSFVAGPEAIPPTETVPHGPSSTSPSLPASQTPYPAASETILQTETLSRGPSNDPASSSAPPTSFTAGSKLFPPIETLPHEPSSSPPSLPAPRTSFHASSELGPPTENLPLGPSSSSPSLPAPLASFGTGSEPLVQETSSFSETAPALSASEHNTAAPLASFSADTALPRPNATQPIGQSSGPQSLVGSFMAEQLPADCCMSIPAQVDGDSSCMTFSLPAIQPFGQSSDPQSLPGSFMAEQLPADGCMNIPMPVDGDSSCVTFSLPAGGHAALDAAQSKQASPAPLESFCADCELPRPSDQTPDQLSEPVSFTPPTGAVAAGLPTNAPVLETFITQEEVHRDQMPKFGHSTALETDSRIAGCYLDEHNALRCPNGHQMTESRQACCVFFVSRRQCSECRDQIPADEGCFQCGCNRHNHKLCYACHRGVSRRT